MNLYAVELRTIYYRKRKKLFMNKIYPVLIILLLLSACNFPGESDYSQDPVVQTSVALILTQGAQTKEITALEPTVTNLPTQVETPTAETPTLTPTAVTESPTATELLPSQTPVPTQVVSNDPWDGDAAFIEEFDSGDYWDFESDHLYSKIGNGQLEFTSKGTPWWSSWYTTEPEIKNGYVETTFSMPNCKGQDRFGLVIRWGNSSDFYYMGVTCDGSWGFTLYTAANETIDLLPYQTSDAFNPLGEIHQIGILAKDNVFNFFIDRQDVGSITNDAVVEGGNFGFLTMSSGTQDFRVLIDRLEYWD